MNPNSANKQEQNYNLSVGAFANLCNTTRDTLRHYYEIGLLVPKTDKSNGYHYYDSSQITAFYFISIFRSMGCSLKEIQQIINSDSTDEMISVCNSRIDEMKLQLSELQQKINFLKNGLWIFEKYSSFQNHRPVLDTLPSITLYKTKIAAKKRAYHASDIAKDMQKHLKNIAGIPYLSAFPMGTTIALPDVEQKNYVYSTVFSISQDASDNVHIFPLPSHRIISCYHDHNCQDIAHTYEALLAFAGKNNLTICSDLHIINLFNVYNLNQNHTYFKYLFFCVKDASG